MDTFHQRRVTVMGLGRFGGGTGVTRWLLQQGAEVLLTDLAEPHDLGRGLEQIGPVADHPRLTLRLGEHLEDDFTDADLIVASPAVPRPWSNPFLAAAERAGIPRTTEMRLVVERLARERTIGITGSAGKSTTAAMIHHILRETGHPAHLGGNIGGSLLDTIESIQPDDWVVLELSSAMLHWLGEGVGTPDAPGWSPHVGVLTNLAPNHLDWHGSMDHYESSKQNIFRYQQPGDHRITEDQFQARRELPLQVPGKHNQVNGMFAIAAAHRATGILPGDAARALATFSGLPHRLELVAESDGRRFYNDSKATLPSATIMAVDAFPRPSRLHVIVGGYDKGVDLQPLADLRPRVAGLYCVGATGGRIATLAEAVGAGAGVGAGHVERCRSVEDAVARAAARLGPEDILLLSPGCASWDQYEDYERRGEAFRAAVRDICGE